MGKRTERREDRPTVYHLSNGKWAHPDCYYEITKAAESPWRAALVDETATAWPTRLGRPVVCALCGTSEPHRPLPGDVPVRGTRELGALLAELPVYEDDAIIEVAYAFHADESVPMHTARKALSELRFWLNLAESGKRRTEMLEDARDGVAKALQSAGRGATRRQ